MVKQFYRGMKEKEPRRINSCRPVAIATADTFRSKCLCVNVAWFKSGSENIWRFSYEHLTEIVFLTWESSKGVKTFGCQEIIHPGV